MLFWNTRKARWIIIVATRNNHNILQKTICQENSVFMHEHSYLLRQRLRCCDTTPPLLKGGPPRRTCRSKFTPTHTSSTIKPVSWLKYAGEGRKSQIFLVLSRWNTLATRAATAFVFYSFDRFSHRVRHAVGLHRWISLSFATKHVWDEPLWPGHVTTRQIWPPSFKLDNEIGKCCRVHRFWLVSDGSLFLVDQSLP